MRLSTRNSFKGTVKNVNLGAVNAEITLEIATGVEVVSVITKYSAKQLELVEAKEAYTLINSTDVAIAVE
jgi:molybdopterin-binding protein